MTVRCPGRFYVETLGCPKNAVDSDKVVASLLADGLEPGRAPSDADLVVVNTCAFIEAARQESIDVALALSDARKPGAKLVVTGCMAERYGDELAAALPEADAVVGFAARARSPTWCCAAQAHRCPRPARAAAARAERAVGVREDRRGLRPRVRVLRDPVVPRQAALADAGVDRGRSARARRTRRRPSSCSSRRTSRGTGATRTSRVRSRRCCAGSTRSSASGSTRVRLLYLYPSEVRDPLDRDDARAAERRAVLRPLAAARGAGTVAPHEAVGERRALRRHDRGHPRRRSPTPRSGRRSSSGSRARPNPTTRSCSRSSPRRSSTGPGSSRSPKKRARPRRRWTARSTTR